MEEAPENGKESLHSAHANGMNEWILDEEQKIFQIKHSCLILYVALQFTWYTHQKQVCNNGSAIVWSISYVPAEIYDYLESCWAGWFLLVFCDLYLLSKSQKCELIADSISWYFLFFKWCGEWGRYWEVGYWKWLNLSGERFFHFFGQLARITVCDGSAFCLRIFLSPW
jgi:hypothetical protein